MVPITRRVSSCLGFSLLSSLVHLSSLLSCHFFFFSGSNIIFVTVGKGPMSSIFSKSSYCYCSESRLGATKCSTYLVTKAKCCGFIAISVTHSCQLLQAKFEKTLIEVSLPVFRLFNVNTITYSVYVASHFFTSIRPT